VCDLVDYPRQVGFIEELEMSILKYKSYEGSAELDMARGVCRGKILFISGLVTYKARPQNKKAAQGGLV
jgi:hypothetical protein